jgi:UPF0716 family protein affecting phage T7 exclusion
MEVYIIICIGPILYYCAGFIIMHLGLVVFVPPVRKLLWPDHYNICICNRLLHLGCIKQFPNLVRFKTFSVARAGLLIHCCRLSLALA